MTPEKFVKLGSKIINLKMEILELQEEAKTVHEAELRGETVERSTLHILRDLGFIAGRILNLNDIADRHTKKEREKAHQAKCDAKEETIDRRFED